MKRIHAAGTPGRLHHVVSFKPAVLEPKTRLVQPWPHISMNGSTAHGERCQVALCAYAELARADSEHLAQIISALVGPERSHLIGPLACFQQVWQDLYSYRLLTWAIEEKSLHLAPHSQMPHDMVILRYRNCGQMWRDTDGQADRPAYLGADRQTQVQNRPMNRQTMHAMQTKLSKKLLPSKTWPRKSTNKQKE